MSSAAKPTGGVRFRGIAPRCDDAARSSSAAIASGFCESASSSIWLGEPTLTSEMGGAPSARASSSASSFAVWKRLFGSRSSAFLNQASNAGGRSGRMRLGTGSCAAAIAANVIATPWSVFQTGRPVRHSNVMQPRAQRSARWSTVPCPLTCSGDMYAGVPNTAPSRVRRAVFSSGFMGE